MLLLLDLDDTIFETQSMSAEIFLPVFKVLRENTAKVYSPELAQAIEEDLWKIPFDAVVIKYKLSEAIQSRFLAALEQLEFDLNINTFPDYQELLGFPAARVLVTTGFRKLQLAKIRALNIQEDFEAIYIDDPFQKDRTSKKQIFQEILRLSRLSPKEVWVIGDNPNSEIKAGKELGMPTIQRLNQHHPSSTTADYAIHSFRELSRILFPNF